MTTLFSVSILRISRAASPETDEENLSKPKYIYDEAIEDCESAIDLVQREQSRLIKNLSNFFNLETEAPHIGQSGLLELFNSNHRIANVCQSFLRELDRNNQRSDLAHKINSLQQCNMVYETLLSDLLEFSEQALSLTTIDKSATSINGFVHKMEIDLHLSITMLTEMLERTKESPSDKLINHIEALNSSDALYKRAQKIQDIESKHAKALHRMSAIYDRTIWAFKWYTTQFQSH